VILTIGASPPGQAMVIVRFSELATELGDVLDAAEANPVIASPRGGVAVDALLIARADAK
jgi:acetate---CoA ligase (ADP-forming)